MQKRAVGSASQPLENTPVFPRKYLAIATSVRMRVAPAFSHVFILYIATIIRFLALLSLLAAFDLRLGFLVRIFQGSMLLLFRSCYHPTFLYIGQFCLFFFHLISFYFDLYFS